jgi:hypothetical protein
MKPKQGAPPEPWWMDAHLFLPLTLGPFVFLLSALPGLESHLAGQPMVYQVVLQTAAVRFFVFSLLGFGLGLAIRHVGGMFVVQEKGAGVDFMVGAEGEEKKDGAGKIPGEQLQPQPVIIPLRVENLQPGMKIAASIMAPDGRQISIGAKLATEELIEEVRQAGVEEVMIEGIKYVDSSGVAQGDIYGEPSAAEVKTEENPEEIVEL